MNMTMIVLSPLAAKALDRFRHYFALMCVGMCLACGTLLGSGLDGLVAPLALFLVSAAG